MTDIAERLRTIATDPDVVERGYAPVYLEVAAEVAADKRANEGFADAIRSNAIAVERERCAQVADAMTEIFGHGRIAAAIRALKEKP